MYLLDIFQITGNLLLMVFYGAILGVAAKCISGKFSFPTSLYVN